MVSVTNPGKLGNATLKTKRQWKQENKSKKEKEQKDMCCCIKGMKGYRLAWKLHQPIKSEKSSSLLHSFETVSCCASHLQQLLQALA
jgi:hypothetical protein